jgi:hypothetical protein
VVVGLVWVMARPGFVCELALCICSTELLQVELLQVAQERNMNLCGMAA